MRTARGSRKPAASPRAGGRTQPRKHARQERAKSTVAAILEATAIVLVKEGYERASTNRIAKVAGVSIASLYQYFPNRDALVAALIDRHYDDVLRRLVDMDPAPADGRAVARALVRTYFETFREAPELHAVLAALVPRVERSAALDEARRAAVARVRALIDAYGAEVRVADHDAAAFVLVNAVEAIAVAALRHRPDDLRNGRAAAWAADLVVPYLFEGRSTGPIEM